MMHGQQNVKKTAQVFPDSVTVYLSVRVLDGSCVKTLS